MECSDKKLNKLSYCLSALITAPREEELGIEDIHNVKKICKKIVLALPEEDLKTLFRVDAELMAKSAEDFEKVNSIFD